MDLGLTGRRAVVTGGSRGLGRAICTALAAEGAEVVTCGRDAAALEETLGALTGRARADVVDVSSAESFRAWLDQAVAWLGGVDVFIANASAMAEGDDPAAWNDSLQVDLMHCVRGCEVVVPHMSEGGSIVLVSSAQAAIPSSADDRAYAVAKAAVTSYGYHLAHEVAPRGIRVNSVLPGGIDIPGGFWEQARAESPDLVAAMASAHALGRLAEPEEIVAPILFLASPVAGFITGSALRVDGGLIKSLDL